MLESLFNDVAGLKVYNLTILTILEILTFQKQPPDVFCKERCSQKFSKFKGKNLCQRLLFNKVAGLETLFFNKVVGLKLQDFLLKKSLRLRCFPVNFAKFPRTPCLQNTSGRLLLHFHYEKETILSIFLNYLCKY